jgi:hypothetical protein
MNFPLVPVNVTFYTHWGENYTYRAFEIKSQSPKTAGKGGVNSVLISPLTGRAFSFKIVDLFGFWRFLSPCGGSSSVG